MTCRQLLIVLAVVVLAVLSMPVMGESEPEGTIDMWDVNAPDDRLDEHRIDATFHDIDGEELFEKSTTDGQFTIEGVEDTVYSVTFDYSADDYHDRTVIIHDIYGENDVFLVEDSDFIDTVDPQFVINDETGQFDPTTSRVFLERSLEIDGDMSYVRVAGEEIGVDGYRETLQEDIRYRLVVENVEGDTRVLGKFKAQDDATYTLVVEDVTFDIGTDDDEVEWSASYESREDLNDLVRFNYSDEGDATTSIDVLIHERGNESNVVHDQTHSGPYGELAIVEQTPLETEWTITWEATRDGTDLEATTVVGPRGHLDAPLDDRWRHTIAVSILLVIGGLASRANAVVVSVSVASVAGMFWYIAWLPADITAGIIVLAFVFPAVSIARNGGGF